MGLEVRRGVSRNESNDPSVDSAYAGLKRLAASTHVWRIVPQSDALSTYILSIVSVSWM